VPDEFEHLKRALAERYAVARELGRGGMATVHLAHDLKHDRPVALKVLRPDLSATLGPERFLREITVTARLEHPHILPLLDSGEAGGLLYYVMPYVEGESLRDRLSREKQLPLDDALRITSEVADALSYAHSQGILHRDIKPENILLAGGHARVMDFGIARAMTADGQALTNTGLAVGTPAYMSPEQAAGERALDARTDIYSLACVAYEMLAGQPPFTGATPQAILARKSLEPVPRLRVVRDAVPEAVEEAIVRALARVPADRFVSVSDFAEALDRGRQALRPASLTARRQHARRLLVGGAAALVAVTAGWYSLTRPGPARPRMASLAVLPLDNLTGDSAQQHFVDAMHDAVVAELAQIRALTVISRQSVLRYRDTEKPVPEIARELNVDGVVEGSVFRAGDTVRITVQVLQARPVERQLWAGSFQRDLRGVLALHGQVARTVAEQIEVAVTPDELRRLTRARPVDAAAYQAWLRGWAAMLRASGPSAERCITHAEEAAAIDPEYAPAYALAAYCHIWIAYLTPTPPRTVFPKVKAAAQRAIQIEPSLGVAHAALAGSLWLFEWDWSGADRAFRRAIELAPSDGGAHWQYSFFLASMGRHDEAVEHARRAELLSPGAPSERQNVAMVLYLARRYDEAIQQAHRTIDLAPEYGFAYDRLAWAYEAKNMYEEATTAREKAVALTGGADVYRKANLARTYGLSGRGADARLVLDELLALRKTRYVPPTALSHIYIGLGRLDEAIHWLEQAYDGRDGDMPLLKTWPAFDPLRSDPRFQRLLRRMNFPN
jgi:TolB-like protein/tetratricopeptide (TPR) repeat protein